MDKRRLACCGSASSIGHSSDGIELADDGRPVRRAWESTMTRHGARARSLLHALTAVPMLALLGAILDHARRW
jgi:hypothetical protein